MNINTIKSNNKIAVIETIRGLAALAVCLYHFANGDLKFVGFTVYYQKIADFGWLGVEAFFVVSGFIIPFSLVKSKYKLNRFFQFFSKRCLRIEPPYIVSIVLVIVLGYWSTKFAGFKGAPFEFNFGQTISHIAYLPEHLGYKWLLPVYWTLEAEFHYYILIGLLLPLLWRNKIFLFIGFTVGLGLSFIIPLYVFSFMPLFIMGISVCAFKTGLIGKYELWASLLTCLLVSIIREQPLGMPLVGITTALLITYAEFRSSITDFLGKISFSLYLLHVPIGGRIINLGGRYANTGWKVCLVLMLALFVSLLSSWIFYKLIELPSQKFSKCVKYNN